MSILQLCVFALAAFAHPDHAKRQGAPGSGVLTDFQVYEPVLTPSGSSNQYGCVYIKTLMEYDFANSYGAPFVGKVSRMLLRHGLI